MSEKYSAEKYDPTLAMCSSLELFFDGEKLEMTGVAKLMATLLLLVVQQKTENSITIILPNIFLSQAPYQKESTGLIQTNFGLIAGIVLPLKMLGVSIGLQFILSLLQILFHVVASLSMVEKPLVVLGASI